MSNRDEEASAAGFPITSTAPISTTPITYGQEIGHAIVCDCTGALDLSPFVLPFSFLTAGLGLAAVIVAVGFLTAMEKGKGR